MKAVQIVNATMPLARLGKDLGGYWRSEAGCVGGSVQWVSNDAAKSTHSGSVEVINACDASLLAASHCVESCVMLPPDILYELTVQYFIEDRLENTAAKATHAYQGFTSDDCTGKREGASHIDLGAIKGSWTTSTKEFRTPSATRSTLLTFCCDRGPSTGRSEGKVHFDHMLLRPE